MSDGYHSSSSDEGSDREDNFRFNAGQTDEGDLEAGTNFWYETFSKRGADFCGNLKSRTQPKLKLRYNACDELLLSKSKMEAKQSLHKIRKKLQSLKKHHGLGNQEKPKLDAFDAFAGVLPRAFLTLFKKWLCTGAPENTVEVSFDDVVGWLRCEIRMRAFRCSSKDLERYGASKNDRDSYNIVRQAMTKADRPASKRKVPDGVARAEPNAFDPIMVELEEVCRREWIDTFFVSGHSWVDIDDDKLAYCSRKWPKYGMRTTPTKDKKLKPVIHVMATVGSGFVVFFYADTIFRTQISMMTAAIDALKDANVLLQQVVFFLDRGYLQLSKEQRQTFVTNLVQYLTDHEAMFCGTIKNTPAFPFIIDDNAMCHTNDQKARVRSKKAVLQKYGMRTSFTAKKGRANLKVVVARHGLGKLRAARIATNAPQFQESAYVYEVKSGVDANCPGGVERIAHEPVPPSLAAAADLKEKTKHAFNTMLSTVWQVTRKQGSQDWFLARLFCFSSTSLHAAINCKSSVYFNSNVARQLHRDCLKIAQLKPRKCITILNATDDDDVDELLGRAPRKSTGGNKALPSYWKNNFNSAQLKEEALRQKIVLPTGRATITVLADLLAAAATVHGPAADDSSDEDGGTEEEDENELLEQQEEVDTAKATVAFWQRMTPLWFLRPFDAKEGTATKIGSANEELVLDAIPGFLRRTGRYQARRDDIREYGLLANRKLRACTTSPDGVLSLRFKDNESGEFGNPVLAALEIKTKTSTNTIQELESYITTTGSHAVVECNAGTYDFRRFIPEPSFRTQLCQHATALGLNTVLMAYSVPGGFIKRIVVVHVSQVQQTTLLKLQRYLAETHISCAHGEGENEGETIPSLGEDYTKQYGYACEHHTLELWLHLWRLHSKDVIENGTPPTCQRLAELLVCIWNKFMGHVDVLRKVLKFSKAIRGPDSGPGSLMLFTFLDYTLYNAFRSYQYACMEDKLDRFTSYSQLQSERKNTPFSSFLYLLLNEDLLTSENMNLAFPGLRPTFDGDAYATVPRPPAAPVAEQEATSHRPSRKYGLLKYYVNLESRLIGTHKKERLPQGEKQKWCIACCKHCISGKAHQVRRARETFFTCNTCKVSLCKHCFESFHSPNFTPPACLGLDVPTAMRRDIATQEATQQTTQQATQTQLDDPRPRKRRSLSSNIYK